MTPAEPPQPSFTDRWGACYRLVKPGVFAFGNERPDASPTEQPVQEVEILEPYFMGEHPVTQAVWHDIMGQNPSKFQDGWSAGLRPVESVNMDDVQLLLSKLNADDSLKCHFGMQGFWRLPSEVEWEYVARCGTRGRWWFGDRDAELDAHGWHAGNSGGHTREVGLKQANPWGFHDMNGLVQEWCADHWERDLSTPRTQQPLGNGEGEKYAVRGGAWFAESDSTRNASRAFAARNKCSDGLGLRLVWEPVKPVDST